MEQLLQVAEEVNGCVKCPLAKGRLKAVPGDGPANAPILFIGEAPGWHENQQGRPFVGPAGQLLNELIGSIGLDREQVFITNVVKCRPSGNRDPMPGEIEACSEYLERQIAVIKPRAIVTLGRFSMARFFPRETISKIHGQPRRFDGRLVFPMYHPAAALHQGSLRQTLFDDMKNLKTALEEAVPAPEPEPPPDPRQLSLF